jgi:flagellar biosynthesis/type III secretory pathway protein FliH
VNPRGKERVIDGEVVDARLEATRLLEAARLDAAALHTSAEAAGFEAGRQAGLASVTEAAVAGVAGAARRLANAEADLVHLAVAIAEKIVRRQLTLTPETVADIAADALTWARRRHEVTVRVHPDDVAFVTERLPGVKVTEDDALARGGCVVDTEVGRIDGRLESQLAAIERGLLGS